jgi:hypothetical protein
MTQRNYRRSGMLGVVVDGRYGGRSLVIEPSANNEVAVRYLGETATDFYNVLDLLEAVDQARKLMEVPLDDED